MAALAGRQPVSGNVRLLVGLLGLAIFINYVDRGNLATAGPLLKGEMSLSNTEFGLLVSAFFWTYTPMQLVAGWLAQRFDTYFVLAGGLAIWALATIATGFVGGFAGLVMLRLLLGVGESVAFPCSSKLIAENVSPTQYGLANAPNAIGLSIGPAFGIYAGGMLMAAYGWRVSFIVFGTVSLFWLVPWLMLPRRGVAPHAMAGPAPSLLEIVKRREAWGAAIGHFCINYTFYLILAWLPIYLVKVHGFSMTKMATLGGAIYLLQGLSAIVFGWLPDWWIKRGASINKARKTMMVAGMLLAALFMIAAVVGNAPVALGALLLSGAFGGLTASNLFACGQTLAGPGAAAKWIGFQNFIGNLAGIVAPALTGLLVDKTGGFGVAFAIAAAVSLVGALCWFLVIPRIEPLEWAEKAA